MNGVPGDLPEIRIEEKTSLPVRLAILAGMTFFLVWVVTEFVQDGRSTFATSAAEVWALIIIGAVLMCDALFRSNLRWTIRHNDIQIDRNWASGAHRTEFVRGGDISKVTIAQESDEGTDRYYVRVWLTSGDDIESPMLTSSEQANRVKAEIVRRLTRT